MKISEIALSIFMASATVYAGCSLNSKQYDGIEWSKIEGSIFSKNDTELIILVGDSLVTFHYETELKKIGAFENGRAVYFSNDGAFIKISTILKKKE